MALIDEVFATIGELLPKNPSFGFATAASKALSLKKDTGAGGGVGLAGAGLTTGAGVGAVCTGLTAGIGTAGITEGAVFAGTGVTGAGGAGLTT